MGQVRLKVVAVSVTLKIQHQRPTTPSLFPVVKLNIEWGGGYISNTHNNLDNCNILINLYNLIKIFREEVKIMKVNLYHVNSKYTTVDLQSRSNMSK